MFVVFKKACDVYEEAIETVITVRDFTQVFDAYAQFCETLISTKMESTAEAGPTDDGELYLLSCERTCQLFSIF